MSITNELFNSFCLALHEDLKHRRRQTAAINGIVADIERQADEAVARIQSTEEAQPTPPQYRKWEGPPETISTCETCESTVADLADRVDIEWHSDTECGACWKERKQGEQS